jgi:hypothetical protein
MARNDGRRAPRRRVRPSPSPELRAKVTRTRAAQGLPATVQDPAVLERVAAVLRLVPGDGEPDAMRLPVQRKPRTARREVARGETTP